MATDDDLTINHPVVSHDEWIAARRELLEKEKAFTRQSDEMSRLRRLVHARGDGGQARDLQLHDARSTRARTGGPQHFLQGRERRGVSHHSCYDRGNDKLNVHYHYLDLVPKGRDDGGRGPYRVRRSDEYD
ncbi:MAG TPA: DUF899 family protein [Vicinamibacterales bacterium]